MSDERTSEDIARQLREEAELLAGPCPNCAALEAENARLREDRDNVRLGFDSNRRLVKELSVELARLKSPSLPEDIGKLLDDASERKEILEAEHDFGLAKLVDKLREALVAQVAETERVKKKEMLLQGAGQILQRQLSEAVEALEILTSENNSPGAIPVRVQDIARAALAKIREGG